VGPVFSGFQNSGFRGFKCQQQHKTFPEVRKGKGGTRIFGISEFGVSGFQMSNIQHKQISNKNAKRREGGTRISGFRGSKLHEFNAPNLSCNQPPKCEKWKLRGFGVRNFVSSESIHQYTRTSERRKGSWTKCSC
jgi:hypothetical protein